MKEKIIPITFSVDDNYVKHAATVMVSILSNSDSSYTYEFIVFDNGIKEATKELLRKVISRYGNARVKFIDIRDKTAGFLTTSIKTSAIFDRLFIPEVLKEYKKIIQLDADMVVLGDISKLFNEDTGNCYIGCVQDRFVRQHISDRDTVWLRDVEGLKGYDWASYTRDYLKMKHPENYFNAGMMLMNLELMRKDKISPKLVAYLLEHQPLALCDQDVLNAVIGDKKKLLSPRWNFVIDYSILHPGDAYSREGREHPYILHRKLWDGHFLRGYSEYYYQYLPEEFGNLQRRKTETVSPRDITFVCTGKIIGKGRYATARSLRSVRKYFPEAEIVLSTWEGEDLSGLDGLYDRLVLNKKMEPEYSAHLESCPWKAPNTYDLQQYSVNRGLKACRTKYAVRWRTDFVLQNGDFLKNYNTFNRLFDMYEANCRIFEQRVLIHKTLTVNPHAPDLAFAQHPADLFHFGLTEDLLRLWDGRPMPKGVYDFFCRGAGQPNPCRFASRYIIEQYLWVALLEKAGKAAAVPEYYLATSPRLKELTDRFFVSNFLIFDQKMLGAVSKFDKMQRKQQYRFFSFRHFCNEYTEHVDRHNDKVKDILKLYAYKDTLKALRKRFRRAVCLCGAQNPSGAALGGASDTGILVSGQIWQEKFSFAAETLMEIKFSDITVVVQGAVYEGITVRAVESVRRFLPGARVVFATCVPGGVPDGGADAGAKGRGVADVGAKGRGAAEAGAGAKRYGAAEAGAGASLPCAGSRETAIPDVGADEVVAVPDPGGFAYAERPGEKINNVNRQIANTAAGLKKVRTPYALKLRSDFLLTGNGFLRYFDAFPAADEAYRAFGHKLLACCYFARNPRSDMPFPFHPSDLAFFGRTEDLLRLYDIPLMTREQAYWNRQDRHQYQYVPEQYLFINCLKRGGFAPECGFYNDCREAGVAQTERFFASDFIFLTFEQFNLRPTKATFDMAVHPNAFRSCYTHIEWRRLYRDYADAAHVVPERDEEREKIERLYRRYRKYRFVSNVCALFFRHKGKRRQVRNAVLEYFLGRGQAEKA